MKTRRLQFATFWETCSTGSGTMTQKQSQHAARSKDCLCFMSPLSANIHASFVLADESWALDKEEDMCIQLTTTQYAGNLKS